MHPISYVINQKETERALSSYNIRDLSLSIQILLYESLLIKYAFI